MNRVWVNGGHPEALHDSASAQFKLLVQAPLSTIPSTKMHSERSLYRTLSNFSKRLFLLSAVHHAIFVVVVITPDQATNTAAAAIQIQ